MVPGMVILKIKAIITGKVIFNRMNIKKACFYWKHIYFLEGFIKVSALQVTYFRDYFKSINDARNCNSLYTQLKTLLVLYRAILFWANAHIRKHAP